MINDTMQEVPLPFHSGLDTGRLSQYRLHLVPGTNFRYISWFFGK